MTSRPKISKGDKIGGWTLRKRLGSGGNGVVWEAENQEKKIAAIKILTKIKELAYCRFIDEIKVIKENSDIEGIIPILDYHLPESLEKSVPWYVMPKATPLADHLRHSNTIEIINEFISLSNTLNLFHKRKITHRDIKPGNLLYLETIPRFADFGLVDYPDKIDVTQKGAEVGPKWTMAPEMKRDAHKSNGKPADVYSLAKTLWIFLTREKKGFEGQYSDDGYISLRQYIKDIYYPPLDKLLSNATSNNPSERPTAKQFERKLLEWTRLNEDWSERNPVQWRELQEKLFPTGFPLRAQWEDIESIVRILKLLGETDSLNHMFLPSGGGADLNDAAIGYEHGCIELIGDGRAYIVKPKRLCFESFGVDAEWNYFRLETSELAPSGVYPNSDSGSMDEEVTEIEPGRYVHFDHWQYNEFNGDPLSEDARPIVRFFRGDFVIFQKSSTYNGVPQTYDARHNQMSSDEFRTYIGKTVNHLIESGRLLTKDKLRENKTNKTEWKKHFKSLNAKMISEIIQLSEFAHSISAKNEIVHLSDIEIDDFLAPRPGFQALTDKLSSLTLPQLSELQGLMWLGRGAGGERKSDWRDILSNSKDQLQDSTPIYIAEKWPLAKYLKDGLRKLSLSLPDH